MECLANGLRLLTIILPIVTSVLAKVELSTINPSVTTSNTGTPPTPTIPPTTTANSIRPSANIDAGTSSILPTPISTPVVPRMWFIEYRNDTLILNIREVTVTYENVQFHTSNLADIPIINTTLAMDVSRIKLERYYLLHNQKHFYISFMFRRDEGSSPPLWHMENFQHQNYTEDEDQRFQYRGIELVTAAIGQAFTCPSVKLHGSTANSGSEEDNMTITSDLTFESITVQPFIRNGKLSSDIVVCGEEPTSVEGLDVRPIIGVVGGVCGIVLCITLVLAVIVVLRSQRRGYDLLRN